ncbi:MAG: hypothetical protein IJ895_02615, partial [Prevotella sp.]|nr:hypothetical protein [Prevotella sp.]
VKSGTSTIASFTVPSTYSASSGGGNQPFSFGMDVTAPGGPGGMGGQGSNILISAPGPLQAVTPSPLARHQPLLRLPPIRLEECTKK